MICTFFGFIIHILKYFVFLAIDSKWTVARIADSRIKRFLENVFNTINSQETFYIGGNTDVSEGNTLDDDNFGSDSGMLQSGVNFTPYNSRTYEANFNHQKTLIQNKQHRWLPELLKTNVYHQMVVSRCSR